MKFAWKMIVMVALLLTVSLAVGGYVAVDSAMRSELDSAILNAQEDMRYFGITLQALCLDAMGQEAEEAVANVLSGNAAFTGYRVSTVGGRTVVRTENEVTGRLGDLPQGMIEARVVKTGAGYAVHTAQYLPLCGEVFGLERVSDVSDVFAHAQRNLRTYRIVLLLVLAVGGALTTAFTLILTQPIRRISRTAKQLAEGRYDRRVNVRSRDELGQMAQDFNAMADALESKIRELEDAAQRQREFTASFAHELKTPLTSVIGYADTLRSRVLPAQQQMEAASYIFSEGRRLEAMSFALLDLFALEGERPQFRMVSAGRLAQEVERSCAYLMKNSGVELRLQVAPAQIRAVPELLTTLLYNLVDNARKASERGAAVTLSAQGTDFGYRFCVTDTGRGIPQEALARITEPFYMVDKSRARAQGGAGLGLALCKKIAELHGATLHFASEVGRGTCVSFTLGGEAE